MIHFGEFALDLIGERLLRDGSTIDLQPKSWMLLERLVSSPGRLWTREELDAVLWPGLHVTEDSLSQCVRRVRIALGDDARRPRFVETVPRRGFRWIGSLVGPAGVAAPMGFPRVSRPEDAFFGRGDDLAAIDRSLERSRLVTVVGPGGIGKSRLALEAVFDRSPCLCRVGEATDRDGVLAAVARGLGISADIVTPERIRSVLAAAAPHQVLLIDEVEGVALPVTELLTDWLVAAPELRLLVTSRVRLGLAAEHVVEIGPLGIDDAIVLYRDRVLRVDSLARDADEDVRALVEVLGAFPLSIELAAARRPLLSAAEILARLGRSVDVLDEPWPDRPCRQRSMRATLAWSWSMLSQPERAALMRIAAFRSGIRLDVAELLLCDLGDPLVLLTALRRHSWIVRREDERLDMYGVLRAFADAECDAAGHRAEVASRHSQQMTDFFRRHEFAPTVVIHAERENLWSAFHAATDPEEAMWLALGLVRADYGSVDWTLLYAALDRVLEMAKDAPLVRSRMLRQRARLALRDDGSAALAFAREALALAGADVEHRSESLRVLGLTLAPGDPERLGVLNEAVVLSRAANLPMTEAGALGNCGMVLIQSGRFREAAEALQQAVAGWRQLGQPWQEARLLQFLAKAEALCQNLDAARTALLRAIEVLDPRLDGPEYARCLLGLAAIAVSESRLDDAEALAVQVEEIDRSAYTFQRLRPTVIRAEVALLLGDFARCEQILASAAPAAARLDPFGRAEHAEIELLLCIFQGQWALADHNIRWRREIYEKVGYAAGSVAMATWAALLAAVRGDMVAARHQSEEAIAGIDRSFPDGIGQCYKILARVAVALAAFVAADSGALSTVRAELSALDLSVPLGPTTGRPAWSLDLWTARVLCERLVGSR